ncbi:hypothetical protein KY342_03095 [Candidatus Woesearchaeota archaeon]|nr:hypothetical protein [Candidatus Woesearchaeota archaeon]
MVLKEILQGLMTIPEYKVNSAIKKIIDRMADNIILKKPITVKYLKQLIRLLGASAKYIIRKKDFRAVRSFCGGLADAFSRAVELEKVFERETNAQISNILTIIEDMKIEKIGGEEEIEKEVKAKYGGLDDIKGNIQTALNQLAASIKIREIPKTLAAESKAKKTASAT